MKTNQAFTILQKAGGTRAAKIITRNKLSALRVWRIARQLRRGMPVAKIVHEKWFYGLPFYTNRHTLDPRPDTETLAAAVISDKIGGSSVRVLDLGTGTGCLIAAIVKNIPNAAGIAIDKSFGAVRVARKNIKNLGLKDKVEIYRRSFDSNLNYGQFDAIVSNPPYIAKGDARINIGALHDPEISLYAANNGLAAYETIARRAAKWLKPGGKIYLEIGADQGPAARDIFIRNGWNFDHSFDDLAGIERVLSFNIEINS
ncbi:MAG: peptide chain release factor N(5)-glutamine methyltransferase [Rickettsiales bacterium]|jgi:release factor glutamine methyltransferase|nr:peptide chain release factor N(5)-glutamine methyltransferase [Rickettsiales bacterium]